MGELSALDPFRAPSAVIDDLRSVEQAACPVADERVLPDVLARRAHFGLTGIQERAILYVGQLTIRSVPDEGRQVTVRLPYPAQT
jgi:hypothetical protein